MSLISVRCPKCKNSMNYMPKGKPKKKRCVYCGSTFNVHANIDKSRII